MTYVDAVESLAVDTEDRVAHLWDRVESGDLTVDQFATVTAAVLLRANVRGVALGDAGLAAALTRRLGRFVSPVGLSVGTGEAERLSKATHTLVGRIEIGPADPRQRIRRIGRAEPMQAAQNGWHEGMRAHQVGSWTRQTTGRNCPFCTRLADGTVLPPSVPMATHPGCDCIAAPVA